MLLKATKEEIDAAPLMRMGELAFFAVHLGIPGAYALDFVYRPQATGPDQQEALTRLRLDPKQVRELWDTLTHAMRAGKEGATVDPKQRH